MSQQRRRVAIIFDNFGNPNQPFLREWFLRISDSQVITVKGFTDKAARRVHGRVVILKPRRFARAWAYVKWQIRKRLDRNLRNVPLKQFELMAFRPSVIHILNAQQYSIYKDTIEKLKCKVIVSFRGYETSVKPQRDEKWLEELRLIYRKADKLHFVSEFLMREAIALGATKEKCVVIRRSVDTTFFAPAERHGKVSSSVKLLAVGRLTWQKGYEILLASVSELVSRGYSVKLNVVGEGSDRPKLEGMMKSLGIEDVVSFQGQISRAQLRQMFWDADIFVQASVSDALPNSILEACACGLAVVSTTAGGIPEAVRDGFSGILVTPGSVEKFANAIEGLIEDVALRVKLGMNGRNFMLEEYSIATEGTRWHEFYLTV